MARCNSGMRPPEGTGVERFHADYAARNGVLAVQLAVGNTSAPECGLAGKYGFLALYAKGNLRPGHAEEATVGVAAPYSLSSFLAYGSDRFDLDCRAFS